VQAQQVRARGLSAAVFVGFSGVEVGFRRGGVGFGLMLWVLDAVGCCGFVLMLYQGVACSSLACGFGACAGFGGRGLRVQDAACCFGGLLHQAVVASTLSNSCVLTGVFGL
jgi:hypothetical protein